MANKRIDQPTGTETVGHEWDGIEELNTPLPRWWLWLFYITIAWAAIYVVLYPAIPMLFRATEGYFGWTSRGQLADEMSVAETERAPLMAMLASMPVEEIPNDPGLLQQAVAGGRAAFQIHCAQCHGAGAAGSPGYPNLADDDWLWGGDLRAIQTTLTHGIRQPGDGETRMSAMPPLAGAFSPAQMNALVGHVLSLSGQGQSNAVGAQLYADNCVACHGVSGEGDRLQGAPRLDDAITLYGSSREAIARQIEQPRMGVMPSWQGRLDPVTIKMLAAYVHSLGGGEAFAEAGPAPTREADEQP